MQGIRLVSDLVVELKGTPSSNHSHKHGWNHPQTRTKKRKTEYRNKTWTYSPTNHTHRIWETNQIGKTKRLKGKATENPNPTSTLLPHHRPQTTRSREPKRRRNQTVYTHHWPETWLPSTPLELHHERSWETQRRGEGTWGGEKRRRRPPLPKENQICFGALFSLKRESLMRPSTVLKWIPTVHIRCVKLTLGSRTNKLSRSKFLK